MKFKGKNVLITGASRGIGGQLVYDFLREGANVMCTYRTPVTTPAHRPYIVDFGDDVAFEVFLKALRNTQIDIVVNNVGINIVGPIEEKKEEEYDRLMCVNVKRAYQIVQAVAPRMKAQGSGKIVNISSISGTQALPGRSLYTTSKFALNGLTKAAAVEFAPSNILVNSVSPGPIMTDMTWNILGEEGIARVSHQIPVGRIGRVDEVSNLVMFLTSDLNSYITGQDIKIDGGISTRWMV